MFTNAYLKKLGERVLTAFATTLAALLTAGGTGLLDAPWQQSLSAAGMAALLMFLTSIAGGAATSSSEPALTSKSTELEVAHSEEPPYDDKLA